MATLKDYLNKWSLRLPEFLVGKELTTDFDQYRPKLIDQFWSFLHLID